MIATKGDESATRYSSLRGSLRHSPKLAPLRTALDAMLGQHEPFPAVAMGREWDVVRANRAANRLFAFLLGPERADKPANVLRLMFSAEGLRPYVKNWIAWPRR